MPTAERAGQPFPQHLYQQIGAAIDYLRMLGEVRHCVHHAEDLQHGIDALQRPDCGDNV